MPGYVKYCYKDGVLLTHIKSALKNYCISILTVQIIVAKNALIFMSKILRFTSDMPRSIRNLFHLLPQAMMPPMKHHLNGQMNMALQNIGIQCFLKAHHCIIILSTQIQQYMLPAITLPLTKNVLKKFFQINKQLVAQLNGRQTTIY